MRGGDRDAEEVARIAMLEREAYNRGRAAGAASAVILIMEVDRGGLRDVVFSHFHDYEVGIFAGHQPGDKCHVCDELVDALLASGIIRQVPPTDSALRVKIEGAVASAQNVPFVGARQRKIAAAVMEVLRQAPTREAGSTDE